MYCINTMAKLEKLREDAARALVPLTKAERQKIDDDASAATQRAWDEYEASRKQQALPPVSLTQHAA